MIDVLAILLDGRAFEPCCLPCPDPALSRLGDGHALAGGDVDTFADIDLDRGLTSVGVLLAGERLKVTVTVAVTVLEHPGFAILAFAGLPVPLPDCHCRLPLCSSCNYSVLCRNMLVLVPLVKIAPRASDLARGGRNGLGVAGHLPEGVKGAVPSCLPRRHDENGQRSDSDPLGAKPLDRERTR